MHCIVPIILYSLTNKTTRHTQASICTLEEEGCVDEVVRSASACLVSCEGVYADIQHITDTDTSSNSQFTSIFEQYNSHKEGIAKNIYFDPVAEHLSEWYYN